MKPEHVLQQLTEAGLYLAVQDGKLICKASEGALTPERRALIGQYKAELMALLGPSAAAQLPAEPSLLSQRSGPAYLSQTQQRLWFIDQLTASSESYVIPVTYRLQGPLDIAALQWALQQIIDRHHSLRSIIEVHEGQPIAVVLANPEWSLTPELIVDVAVNDRPALIHRRLQASLILPFDLAKEIPLKVQLLRFAADDHVLMLTIHHIAADGWSVENLLAELSTLYRDFSAAQPALLPSSSLPPLALQYSDYAAWQRAWLQGERLQQQLDFWRKQLRGAPAVHGLPLDRPRPDELANGGASYRHTLPQSLFVGLKTMSQQQNTTLFMTLLAAFNVLVARWSGETDIVIGTPIANRPRNELAPLIGFFANTLAIRSDLSGDPVFSALLSQVKTATLDAFEYQHLPFEMLVEALNPPRSLSLAPLVQLMFSLQDFDEDGAFSLPDITISPVIPDAIDAKFDINLNLYQTAAGLGACWDYNSDLLDEATIQRLAASYGVLLSSIVANPMASIQRLSLVAAEQVTPWGINAARYPLPPVVGVQQLFEAQAQASPAVIAVTDGREQLSYAQLNERANRVAHGLIAQGVQPDTRVGIYVERGVAMLVGILAILKAGGAYVPLDPAHPVVRLQGILSDSGAKVLLTQRHLATVFAGADCSQMILDDEASVRHYPPSNPNVVNLTQHHLAYVIYTSGSTGAPKGVMVEHQNVLNLIEYGVRRFGPDQQNSETAIKGALWTSFGFDVSVFELFLPLALGGTLHLVPDDIRADIPALLGWLQQNHITLAYLPPFFVRALAHYPDPQIASLSLRGLLLGVEPLVESDIYRLQQLLPNLRVDYGYGPSETTVYSSCYQTMGVNKRNAPIGQPIANTEIHLLDDALQPVPVGVIGEIHIAGLGVARGYLNQPALTASRFIINQHGLRLYKTGDLARWLPEGQLAFSGRKDLQFKFNGIRIEPGEIETVLCGHGKVGQAAVVVRADQGAENCRLVAYVVATDAVETAELREYCLARLPAYMQPTVYVLLNELPLTVNGKLDTQALPLPALTVDLQVDYVAPQSLLEQQLVAMWQALLQQSTVSVTSSFFDMGGHSLLLTRLHNQIRAELAIEVALKDLFSARTIREQARLLAQQQPSNDSLPELVARPATADKVLSFAQRRLWFIDQMGNAGAVYNIPCAIRIVGGLQVDVLQWALNAIMQRHEVLRTSLVTCDGEAQLVLRQHGPLALPIIDLTAAGADAAQRQTALSQAIDTEAAQPFNLSEDPLIRVQLLQLAVNDQVLLLTLHHIAADGWSIGALLNELATLYDGFAGVSAGAGLPVGLDSSHILPPLTVQYADYAYWQQQLLQGDRLTQQLDYWQSQLADLPVLHNLWLDFPRPETQRYRGAMYSQKLTKTLHQQLQQLARTHETTLFITLQAAFAVLLARFSGDTDIVMGTPIANRRHEALTPLIGFFVNTLVLRNDLSENPTFSALLDSANVVALEAYQHQDVPLEMLVDALCPQRSLSHSPLFQVMLSLDNDGGVIPSFGGLEMSDVATESHHAKFDITLNISETADGLAVYWDYNRDLFLPATIARIAQALAALLAGIVADPNQHVQHIPLLAATQPPDEALRFGTDQPYRPLPKVVGVHQLFETKAAAAADAIAVSYEQQQISYGELNRRANQLAHGLMALGVKPDSRVAIHVERSIEMQIGLLAILKAGGAYVPLDPAHPADRLTTILEDSGALVLLSQRHLADLSSASERPILYLDDGQAFAHCPETNPQISELTASHLAYVMYTSGSTGMPKGVMVEHGNILNMVDDCLPHFADDGAHHAAMWSSFGFDVSVFEIFVVLAQGGTLHIVPEAIRADIDGYFQWLADRQITQTFLLPFFVRALCQYSDAHIGQLSLRHVMMGVEPLLEHELYRLTQILPDLVIDYSYGPTETTVYSTKYSNIRPLQRNTPIGGTINNTHIYLLDQGLNPVPVGVIGEIHIAGLGVTRGYLNQPEMTKEKFIFAAGGVRMYKTGDLGRWLPEGKLEFMGRADRQFKFNGVRIEPAEIEAVLCTLAGVSKAAVVVRKDDGPDNPRLVAYVVCHEGVTVQALREYLADRLPSYMQPSAFVHLDQLPLTVNGKFDAKALPAPAVTDYHQQQMVAPATPLEQQLATIWAELLGQPTISVTANFFDLGGHSLNAVRLMSAIRQATGKVLPISMLFKAPTVRALAAQIDLDGVDDQETLVVLRQGSQGVSSSPLFVFHAAGGDVVCYQPLIPALDPQMAVYGFIRSESSNQRVPALKSIEQLAVEYLDKLLIHQPKGPYNLAGWSSGGLLAMQVAALLEARGETVAQVWLIDTMLPTGTEVAPQYHQQGLAHLQQLNGVQACEFMREFDPDLAMAIPVNDILDCPAADYFNYLVTANLIGLDFFQPQFRLKAAVHYVGCTENKALLTVAQRVAQMQTLTAATLTVEQHDADHFSILAAPYATRVAETMAERMAELAAQ